MFRFGQVAGWIAVSLGTVGMFGRGTRRLDRLDVEVQNTLSKLDLLRRRRDRAKRLQKNLYEKFEMVLPVMLARLVETSGPGTEFLGESLLMQVLESLSEEQLKNIVATLDESQQLALFQLYEMYRDKWKKRRADAPEGASARPATEEETDTDASPSSTAPSSSESSSTTSEGANDER